MCFLLQKIAVQPTDVVEKALDSQSLSVKPAVAVAVAESVSQTLQQAREILRQAKAAKDEALQMNEESSRELELARKERHDASLLKKNAAEILRMAKTKLLDKH